MNDIPNECKIDVRVADKLAARINIIYYPALVNFEFVEKAAELAAEKLGDLIAEELNKNEGKAS